MEPPQTVADESPRVVDGGDETISKKKAKKAAKVTKKIKVVPGSVDVRVQHTNDDSVVSKRSAVAMNYFNDPFLRHFVTKPTRRAPLINRGYYLRMLVMTDVVTQSVNHLLACPVDAQCPIQVVSLGAGYDTFAFRALLPGEVARHVNQTNAMRAVCGTLHDAAMPRLQFFDVDFPAVMQAKAALMAAAPTDAFHLKDLVVNPSDPATPVRSAQYHAVGVDLREAEDTLVPALSATANVTGFSPHNPTVIYAECVMQYMPPDAARTLIGYIAKTFTNAIFIAYDQLHPADSFGKVMMHSLRHKNSPLLGAEAAPDGGAMLQRALDAGMSGAFFANFYRLTRHHVSAEEEQRLNSLEAFDEWEEWAEMCEHYGITLGFTNPTTLKACASDGTAQPVLGVFGNPAYESLTNPKLLPSVPAVAALTPEAAGAADTQHPSLPLTECTSPVSVLHKPWPSSRFGYEGWGAGEVFVEAHPSDPLDVIVVSFGGYNAAGKVSQRVATVRAHGMRSGDINVVTAAAGTSLQQSPQPVVFHSVSRIAPYMYVVFGGRTNPEVAFQDAHLLKLEPQPSHGGEGSIVAHWQLLQVVSEASGATRRPSARYRHSAVGVPGERPRIFVCCGCSPSQPGSPANEPAAYLSDAWVGQVDVVNGTIHWVPFSPATTSLPAVCSASLVVLPKGTNTRSGVTLLLSGGIDVSGTCMRSAFCIDLDNGTCSAVCELPGGGGSLLAHARFSHLVTPVEVDGREQLLIFGGCASDEKAREMPSTAVLVDPSLTTPPVALTLPEKCPVALARHAAVCVARGVVAIIGGGYTCFSFGTFTSKPFLLCLGTDYEKEPLWTRASASLLSRSETQRAATQLPNEEGNRNSCNAHGYLVSSLLSLPRPPVEERVYSPEAFLHVARAAEKPVVFRRVPLGPCVERWRSPTYLRETEGDTVVSVHVANAKGAFLLDFVRKNFTFQHVRFAELVSHIEEDVRLAKEQHGPPQDRETWYFRSVANNMKTERANLWNDFKHLGADFELPDGAREYVIPRLHQCCLRLNAAPLQLWTHYDTFDNILCQVVGRKRVVMFPPSEFNNLYMNGSSSPVLNLDYPDLLQYPRFIDACKRAAEVVLEPGDVLFFPANWFHHITTLIDEPEDTYSVSVNLFFDHFDRAVYDRKDLYGNKDIPAVVELRTRIHALAKDAIATQRIHKHDAGKDDAGEALPTEYAQFALRQAIQDLEKLADSMTFEAGQ